ncbi:MULTISPECIES: protein TolR [Cellvibrio]|jgi:biopolymer transport protein TolR|uniref:Tol-Pal system protein TolR n=1 Tax=Cellvibrio fibrivorans TaxID=126350 RepID=A0ABU1V3G7_9GAMM|nr:protein TolR [Cellvibrio fibrivorans]MDO8342535.1 protein TolR [Cellvibrio sp.]MDR7091942.1 biopolymer transport protein TolR [Cellvibrio fibrivorans]
MSGFGPPIKKKLKAEINVVPLIDVMLVLLIVFMIAAPMMTQGIKVELPQAASEPVESKEDEPITVSVKADGGFYIDLAGDPEKPRPLAEIKSIVSKVLAEKPNTLVFVQGDKKVEYGVIVNLMGELKLAGAPSVGLITEPPR